MLLKRNIPNCKRILNGLLGKQLFMYLKFIPNSEIVLLWHSAHIRKTKKEEKIQKYKKQGKTKTKTKQKKLEIKIQFQPRGLNQIHISRKNHLPPTTWDCP